MAETPVHTGHPGEQRLFCNDVLWNIDALLISSFSSCVPTNRKREIWSWLQESANHFLRRTELWLSRMTIWRNEWHKSRRRSAHTHWDRSEYIKWLILILYRVYFKVDQQSQHRVHILAFVCNFNLFTLFFSGCSLLWTILQYVILQYNDI